MKFKKFNRRKFLAGILLASPLLAAADAKWLEPHWIKIRRIRLTKDKPTHRLVHFTDIHHKGDTAYLEGIIRKINALSPDLAFFTGDLIEEQQHLAEALKILSGIKSPLYGVPGNHDYWSKAPFDGIISTFAATGGGFLLDTQQVSADGKFSIVGATCLGSKQPPLKLEKTTRNIFLMHYPIWIENLRGHTFELILAGHSHGGQVRLPLYGAIMLPFGVGKYDLGLFHEAPGPLYVNPGLGWFPVPLRLNCRPEITVFEV